MENETIPTKTKPRPKPFTYWEADPTPIFKEPRWAVGRWGPSMIVQCNELTVGYLVDALNAHQAAGHGLPWQA